MQYAKYSRGAPKDQTVQEERAAQRGKSGSKPKSPPDPCEPLKRPGHEFYAQRVADGMSMIGAYASAGYIRNDSGPTRLNKDPRIIARIDFLVAQEKALRPCRLEDTILALLGMANKADVATAAGLKEARLARLDAYRLRGLLDAGAGAGPAELRLGAEMSEQAWLEQYGVPMP